MMLTGFFVIAMLLAPSVIPVPSFQGARALAPAAVSVPDTAAGQALNEFVASFNAGGDKRRAWLEERTTGGNEMREMILKQDIAILEQQGPMTLVRVADSSPTQIVAIVHHEKTGAHRHLTITVQAAAPHKVSNMRMRAATPDEVKGQ